MTASLYKEWGSGPPFLNESESFPPVNHFARSELLTWDWLTNLWGRDFILSEGFVVNAMQNRYIS